jgi:hypothetical protein
MMHKSEKGKAEWELVVCAWSPATEQLRQYSAYGTGTITEDMRKVKPFLGIPPASKVISLSASFFGKMS